MTQHDPAASAEWSDLGHSTARQPARIPPIDPANRWATSGAPPTASVAMHTKRALHAQVVTPDNFAPFGRVLTPQGRTRLPINTYGDRLNLFRERFDSDQPIEWFIFQGWPRGTGVLFLERHQQLTQTFIPIGGKPFVTVVAPANCAEADGLPTLDQLQAFLVPGDCVIQLERATWHENPMPLSDDTRMLVTSHARLTLAHQQDPDPRLASAPLDLERRWYRAAGYDLTVEVPS